MASSPSGYAPLSRSADFEAARSSKVIITAAGDSYFILVKVTWPGFIAGGCSAAP